MQFDFIFKCYQLTVNNSQNCEVALTESLHFKVILSAESSLRCCSLRKQPTLGDATTGFPAKWRLRNERRNSILMTRHYSDLGSASDWLNQIPTRHDQSEALPRSG